LNNEKNLISILLRMEELSCAWNQTYIRWPSSLKKYYNALNASFAIKKNNVNYIWAQRVNEIRQYQKSIRISNSVGDGSQII